MKEKFWNKVENIYKSKDTERKMDIKTIENSVRYMTICTEFSIWIILKRSHTNDRIIHIRSYIPVMLNVCAVGYFLCLGTDMVIKTYGDYQIRREKDRVERKRGGIEKKLN